LSLPFSSSRFLDQDCPAFLLVLFASLETRTRTHPHYLDPLCGPKNPFFPFESATAAFLRRSQELTSIPVPIHPSVRPSIHPSIIISIINHTARSHGRLRDGQLE